MYSGNYIVQPADLCTYNVPINVNMEVWGGGRRRLGIWTRSNFLRQMPYPRAIIIGQRRTNSPPLQLRLEVKCVSLKETTYQLFEKAASVYLNNYR